jgi:subtilisin family serine protease
MGATRLATTSRSVPQRTSSARPRARIQVLPLRREVLVGVLLLLPTASAALPAAEPWAVRIVGLDPALPLDAAARLAQLAGGVVVRTDVRLHFAVLAAPRGPDLDALRAQPGVRWVEHVQPVRAFAAEPLQDEQYGLDAVRAPEAWKLLPGQHTRALVAVIDTGVDWEHPDLAQVVWNGNGLHGVDLTGYATALQCAWETSRSGDCFYTAQPTEELLGPMDFSGHGTHVASIAAAALDGEGMAGVSDGQVLAIKVMAAGSSVYSTTDVLASAIALAPALGARVISMSLGCSCPSATLQAAVTLAWSQGAVLVAAAGNEDSDQPDYPAAYPEVISVAAVNTSLLPWKWADGLGTNHGPTIDLAAPGEQVLGAQSRWSTDYGHKWRGVGWLNMTGTSMAAPHVAGVAALVIEADPLLSNAQVRSVLEGTAQDRGAPGWDSTYGWGVVDAQAAVRAAASPSP